MKSGNAPRNDRPIFVDDGQVMPPPTSLDPDRRQFIRESIANVGHAVIGGCAGYRKDRLIVTHTIGLTEKGLPEIAISGIGAQDACLFLNMFVDLLKEPIPADEDAIFCDNFMNGYPVMVRPLPTLEANASIAFHARLYYGRAVPIWQMILSDKDRRWPWEEGVTDRFLRGQSPVVDWRVVGPPKS